jgi:hypothetical protein
MLLTLQDVFEELARAVVAQAPGCLDARVEEPDPWIPS